MARVLIVGCGCRGRCLAHELLQRGHLVRGSTREPRTCELIEATGAEAHVGDPGRVATLVPALDAVAIVCVLLGSATGAAHDLARLHGSRLEMLLLRTIDTTVRGVVYEASGSVEARVLRAGTEIVTSACEGSRIPFALLSPEPRSHGEWLATASGAVETLLAGPPVSRRGGETASWSGARAALDWPPIRNSEKATGF